MPEADLPSRQSDAEDEDDGGEPIDVAGPVGKAKKQPSREILIEQVRRIGEFLAVSSHRGGRRVVLLAPAEALNGPAANALLKMLEEPPAGAVFLVVSDEIDAVLATIRSRCVLLRAPAPSRDEALAWLREQGVEDAEDRLAEAGGAPMTIVAEETLDARRRLDPAVREVAVGPAIRLFQRWGWDLLAERAAQRVRYHPGQKRALANLARAVDPPRLADWMGALAEAQAVSEHPLNARLAVEQALLGYLAALQPGAVTGEPEHRTGTR